MQEIVEASKELATWAAGGWATKKLLGPSFDYLGGQIQLWTEKQTYNVNRIFELAVKKLGPKIEQPGIVPPRVLKNILFEGAYCENEIAAEYFSGVLAAARTESGKDDRAIPLLNLLARLSSFQIKAHYILYSAVKSLYSGSGRKYGVSTERLKMGVYIPESTFLYSLGIEQYTNLVALGTHILIGLQKDSLIADHFAWDKPESLNSVVPKPEERGVVFAPSALGAELYLWAHGYSDIPMQEFLNPNIQFTKIESISLIDNAIKCEF
jgi:hypothetical protein